MDTGEIEYRRAEPPPADFAQQAVDGLDRGGLCRNRAPQGERRYRCTPVFATELIRRNATIGDPIVKDEIYSIRIEHGQITNLIETPFSLRRLAAGRTPFRRVGEIAILAHTFEFASTEAAAGGSGFRFADLSSLGEVKVIYYNPDVEDGQSLNFSNIPLIEGQQYQGRPIGIQIIVLELDRLSGPMQSLMRRLAELGQQSAVLPSGPAATTLLNLGSTLISQENDDVMFEYRMVLDPSGTEPSLRSAPFEAGRYVLRQIHERRDMQRWDDLVLDHNTGELLQRVSGPDAGPVGPAPLRVRRSEGGDFRYVPFAGGTYFTLNIIKQTEQSRAAYSASTFRDLAARITEAADNRDRPLRAVTADLAATVRAGRARRWIEDLNGAARAAAARYQAYGRRFVDGTVAEQGQCKETVSPANEAARSRARLEAQASVADFLAIYRRALADVDTNDAGTDGAATNGSSATLAVFGDADQRLVLSHLTTLFLPLPEAAETQMITPASFKEAYLDGSASALLDVLKGAAERNWSLRSCSELIRMHLAEPNPAPAAGGTGN